MPNSYGAEECGTRQVFGNGSAEITLGEWHLIELHVKYSTTRTSKDGILQWWLDGAEVGNYTDVNMGAPPAELQVDPTWGGGAATKVEDDYYDFDHVHVSAP